MARQRSSRAARGATSGRLACGLAVRAACCVLLSTGLWAVRSPPWPAAALPAGLGVEELGGPEQATSASAATTEAPEVAEAGWPQARVGPSLLAGDLSNLARDAQRAVGAGADFLHLDIFDGHWIPGAFTFGPLVVKALRPHVPEAFLDAHLCVTGPERYVEALAEAGVNRYTFHVEAVENPRALAAQVRALGMQAGLAIAPSTPVDARLLDIARGFDMVLVMTVPPGFGGQAFMPEVLPKLVKLRAAFPRKALEVDGGVNAETVQLAASAGASEVVAGTAVFKAKDPGLIIRQLRESLEQHMSLPA